MAVSGYAQKSLVDFEMMTWVEVKKAIQDGKTTALIYNGGTEQRGPQNVNGGHTLMGHATVVAIAEKLGMRSHEEAFAKEIILQGVLSIQAGNNPRVVEMQLMSFLSSKQQQAIPKAA